MKRWLFMILWTFGILAQSHSIAQSGTPSPLLGRWALDVSDLHFPPDATPQSVTMVISDIGQGKWESEGEIRANNGSLIRNEATFALDGTPYPMVGNSEADRVSASTPRPDVLVLALSKAGTDGTTRIYTVSPDGNTALETHVVRNTGGLLEMRTYAKWTRLQ